MNSNLGLSFLGGGEGSEELTRGMHVQTHFHYICHGGMCSKIVKCTGNPQPQVRFTDRVDTWCAVTLDCKCLPCRSFSGMYCTQLQASMVNKRATCHPEGQDQSTQPLLNGVQLK